MRTLGYSLACVALFGACHGQPPTTWGDRIEPDGQFRDDQQHAVVRIGRHCSGTLISPTHVLTAAHCMDHANEREGPLGLYELPFPRVHDEEVGFEVQRCFMHPGAYPGFTGCQGRPNQDAQPQHDLAILVLKRPANVTPVPVRLDAEPPVPDRLWLVGWHRRPRRTGTMNRYAGWTRVVDRGALLVVESQGDDESSAFLTHSGNSGGPALERRGDVQRVVGVLSRHTTGSGRRRSMYAPTTTPINAAWIARVRRDAE